MSYDTTTCKCMIIMDLLRNISPEFGCVRELALQYLLEGSSKSEETSCHEPLRKHVLRSICQQDFVRNLLHQILKFLEVGCTTIFNTRCISEDKVSKCELLLDIVIKLDHQGLGVFPEESDTHLFRNY